MAAVHDLTKILAINDDKNIVVELSQHGDLKNTVYYQITGFISHDFIYGHATGDDYVRVNDTTINLSNIHKIPLSLFKQLILSDRLVLTKRSQVSDFVCASSASREAQWFASLRGVDLSYAYENSPSTDSVDSKSIVSSNNFKVGDVVLHKSYRSDSTIWVVENLLGNCKMVVSTVISGEIKYKIVRQSSFFLL